MLVTIHILFIYSSEVAKHVNQDSYGLIFGFTTFVALVLQSILTIIVINTLKLPIRMQVQEYHYLNSLFMNLLNILLINK